MNEPLTIIPRPGERMLIAGRTGTGKTALGLHILQRLPDPVVIYDTKIEPKFDRLVKALEVHSPDELFERINNNIDVNQENGEESTLYDYFIVRPSAQDLLDPLALDHKWSLFHYNNLHGTPGYYDEIYQWHNNGKPGPGLLSNLTRGRSKGITTIMSTQRPRFLSRFCLTEADSYIALDLSDRDDRKRLADVIRDFDPDTILPEFHFQYFRHGMPGPQLFKPIPLDTQFDTGYTDSTAIDVPIINGREPTEWI